MAVGRVVDLAERLRVLSENGNGHVKHPVTPRLRRWDVDTVTYLATGDYALPTTATVRWLIDIDPVRRRFEVAVCREGWQHTYVIQGGDEVSALQFLNQLLADSFGVPA